MKKILILIPNLNMGGAQKALVSLLNEIDRNKYAITVAVFGGEELIDSIPLDIEVEKWENYYDLLENKYNKSFRKDLFQACAKGEIKYCIKKIRQVINYKIKKSLHEEQKAWKMVEKEIKVKDVDYDLCLSYMQGSATYYMVDKLKCDCPKIAMMNTDYVKAGYNKNFDERYFQRLNIIACVSTEATETLKKAFPELKEKIIKLEDVLSPQYVQKQARLKCDIQLSSHKVTIVSCGRLAVKVKGYDLCMEAAKLLKRAGYDFCWYIIGDGPGKSWMENKIREYNLQKFVILLGTQVNPYPIINQCDIFVQSSRFEGKCLALREAKILHKAIISTNFEAVYSEIEDGVNGVIVQMNADSIFDALRTIIDNDQKREYLIENIVIPNESGIVEYERVFDEILGEKF